MDRRSQAFGGRCSILQAFGGICGSSCTRLLVAYVDRHVEAFGGIRRLPIASPWWLTWIAVHKPLVADGVIYKRFMAYVDRHVHSFGGIRGLSSTRLSVAYADRRLEAFGVIRGLSFASLSWLTWIIVHKPLVAGGVVYKPLVADGVVYRPLVACVDYRV